MDTDSNISEIKKYIELFNSFLGKFVEGGSSFGLFLKTGDESQFKRRIIDVNDLLQELFGPNNTYSVNIINTINTPTMSGGPSYAAVQDVISFLQAAADKLERGKRRMLVPSTESGESTGHKILGKQNPSFVKQQVLSEPVSLIEHLLNRFHLTVHQLLRRHDNRPTLEITDEYDVQDLLNALLRIYFDDIRPEEYVPSYAGGASRVDFLLKKGVDSILPLECGEDEKKRTPKTAVKV